MTIYFTNRDLFLPQFPQEHLIIFSYGSVVEHYSSQTSGLTHIYKHSSLQNFTSVG